MNRYKQFTYIDYLPVESTPKDRKQYFDNGKPKYVVEVYPETNKVKNYKIKLLQDPDYFLGRTGSVLYNKEDINKFNRLIVGGFFIQDIGYVNPENVKSYQLV